MKEQLAAIGIPPVYTPLHEALEKIGKRTEKVERLLKSIARQMKKSKQKVAAQDMHGKPCARET